MEKWKSIKGFEGIYEVSSLGRVRSLDRKIPYKDGFKQAKGKLMKLTKNRLGYMVVTLQKDRKRYFSIVHRLVAKAFIPNPENKREVNHIDSIKDNNNVNNLEWSTRKENMDHWQKNSVFSSKYKGVSYSKERKKWVSYVTLAGKRIVLGRYETEEEANIVKINYLNKLKQDERIV